MAGLPLSYRNRDAPGVLGYEIPFAIGEVRSNSAGDGSLWVNVGPPPLRAQIRWVSPLGLLFVFTSGWFGLLAWFAIVHPGAIPMDRWLLLPSTLVWVIAGAEFFLNFRGFSTPARMLINSQNFSFPFPSPRSGTESVPCKLIGRVTVEIIPARWYRRKTWMLVIGLERGGEVRLFRGYPPSTLHQLADLIGPAVGLQAVPD